MKKIFESESNNYTLYGALFGVVFPVVATGIEMALSPGENSVQKLISTQAGNPLLWIIDSSREHEP